jgi:carbamoyl-phosphate synthase large subunit
MRPAARIRAADVSHIVQPMPQLRLLVLSAGTQVGQNVLATLAGRRANVTISATSSVANEPALFDFDAVFMVPPTLADPAEFEQRLLAIVADERIDLVIPCRDDDVAFLAGLRERRPDLAPRLLCGAAAPARAINDKWLSYEFSMRAGLPFAASMIGTGGAAARTAFIARYGFPIIAKPRGGWSSMDVYLVNTDRQLATMLAREGFVAQQFLGDPQTMHDYLARLESSGVPLYHDFQGAKHSMQALIAPDGAVTDVFCVHRLRQLRRSKWVQPDPDPAATAIARQCAQAFSEAGWRGPLNMQGRRTVDGDIRIHEYSGRFTGATVDRWLLGFDEVGLAIERFTGVRIGSDRATEASAVEAFESRVGRAVDARRVEALARDRVWRRDR